MIEQPLLQYGMAGLFIIYLIYDRQVIIKRLTVAIDGVSEATRAHTETIIAIMNKRR